MDPGGRPTATRRSEPARASGDGPLAALDRLLYALFARHADADRHRIDRRRYRGTNLSVSFETFLARLYALSWPAGLVGAAFGVALVTPLVTRPADPTVVPWWAIAALSALVAGVAAKHAAVRLGGLYLRWRATARRSGIERSLPGAVRYLHVLASGSDSPRGMLERVAATDAYGESAVAFRAVLNTASLTGSLGEGLGRVARDTPSRDLLAPFLLKFREHADQGEAELANYLRMESRMLGHRRERARQRAAGFLELLAEMFMVLLVLPALLVIVLTVIAVIAPGLSDVVRTPVGALTVRGLVVYASAAFVLVVGLGASAVVSGLRPPGQVVTYHRPDGSLPLLATAGRNPASAAVVGALPAVAAVAALHFAGVGVVHVLLGGYVAYALPVGLVALRRARRDDAKDRELKDFVHAVSGHVNLGRPFPEAVELVATKVDLGPLDGDVADLAVNLRFTEPGGSAVSTRTAALDRFVEQVGTPLAEQTVGLVSGGLDAGSDAGTVFDTLQTEIGRLYHEKRKLRSAMLVYVTVGWTTALLVVGITVAVGMRVFHGFEQLASVSGTTGTVIQAGVIEVDRARFRLYAVTQATMLAAGWFSGTASRGRYEALLHSSVLVVACYVVFEAVGMI